MMIPKKIDKLQSGMNLNPSVKTQPKTVKKLKEIFCG